MPLNFYNSHRWTKCPASAAPSGRHAPGSYGITAPRTDSQLEGDAAAWVAAGVLNGDAASAGEFIGETDPGGWTVTADMIRHVERYIEIARASGRQVIAEQDVTVLGGLVTGRPDSHTAHDGETLRVLELKYGWKIVEPENNTQLLLAAIAFVEPHHKYFSLEVFQPRPYHPDGAHRKWVITAHDLDEWAQWFYSCALSALEPMPIAAPGEHCTHCPDTHCHARSRQIYNVFESVGDHRRSTPALPAELGAELSFLRSASALIASKLSSVEAEADARARREFIPGWTLEPVDGRRVVTATPRTVAMLTGVDPYRQVLKSPAELEAEGVHPETIALISNKPRVGFRLVEESSKAIARLFKPSKA